MRLASARWLRRTRLRHAFGNTFVGVSRTSGGSNTVVSGDTIYWGVLDGFRAEADLAADIQNVLTHIHDTYER